MSSGIPGLSTNTESTSWADYFTPTNLALLTLVGLVTLVAIKRIFNSPQQDALAHNPLQGANRPQSLDALDPDNQKWNLIRAANQVYVSSSDDEGEDLAPMKDYVSPVADNDWGHPVVGNAGGRPLANSVKAAEEVALSEAFSPRVLNVDQAKGILTLWFILAKQFNLDIPPIKLEGNDQDLIELAEQFPSWLDSHKNISEGITRIDAGIIKGRRPLSINEQKMCGRLLDGIFSKNALPPEVFNFSNLTELRIATPFILVSIPPEIQQLKKLAKFARVGPVMNLERLFGLESLKILHLVSNQLSRIPAGIAKLTQLEELKISMNKIREIPLEIFWLEELKNLDLSNNPISELPPEISQLKNLKDLNLGATGIMTLPQEILSLDLRRIRLPKIDGFDEAGLQIAQALQNRGVRVTFANS